jgi:hypothetical protein
VSPAKPRRLALGALMAALAAYWAAYVWRMSFVFDGQRRFLLFDDGMISMRYARNLADGFGLVWNPGGPRVEGYTNLGWTLVMALAQRCSPSDNLAILFIQILGMACLALNCLLVWRLGRRLAPEDPWAALGAVALVGAYQALNNWALQGMEVGVVTLILTAVLALGEDENCHVLAQPLLLCLACLVRLDMAAPAMALLALDAWQRRDLRRGLAGLGLVAASLALQEFWRHGYYGDWLPNTYYLKMTGFPVGLRMQRGAFVLGQWALSMGRVLLLLPLGLALWQRKPLMLRIALLFCVQAAYSVYVGGDAWEQFGGANRYLAPALPGLLLLTALALRQLSGFLCALAPLPLSGRKVLGLALFAAALGYASVHEVSKRSNGERNWRGWLLLEKPQHSQDFEGIYRRAMICASLTKEGAMVAVAGGGGTVPYFFGKRQAVDVLGKCDPVISRLPMHLDPAASPWEIFYPGHLKWDYAYSIQGLKPDFVDPLWKGKEAILPYLRSNYVTVQEGPGAELYLKKGSDKVDFGRIPELRAKGWLL